MAKIKWLIDPTHSELGFRVKHLMITNVSGSFSEYEVSVITEDEDFTKAQIHAKIKTASINTNNAQRDQHLRNNDFFDVELFPEIQFRSESMEPVNDEQFILYGHLTMKGVTGPLTLHVEYSEPTTDPWGGRRAGFVITGKIKRTEYGLNFNSILDSGGLALSEDVKIHCEVQLVKQDEHVVEKSA